MHLIYVNMAALSIAVLYYAWREWHAHFRSRGQVLRERVTYMLWVAANQAA